MLLYMFASDVRGIQYNQSDCDISLSERRIRHSTIENCWYNSLLCRPTAQPNWPLRLSTRMMSRLTMKVWLVPVP